METITVMVDAGSVLAVGEGWVAVRMVLEEIEDGASRHCLRRTCDGAGVWSWEHVRLGVKVEVVVRRDVLASA